VQSGSLALLSGLPLLALPDEGGGEVGARACVSIYIDIYDYMMYTRTSVLWHGIAQRSCPSNSFPTAGRAVRTVREKKKKRGASEWLQMVGNCILKVSTPVGMPGLLG
jgi:hypothetical protein